MIMRTRNHTGILLLAACIIFAAPAAGHADNLFRFYPEAQLNGFYGDNIGVRSNNEIGDFGFAGVGGFYLDYTSAARYASLHYDTFAQLYLHRTQLDRAGEGQFVTATDDENLSRTTHLRLTDFYYRDAPTEVTVTTSGEAPQFNTIMAQLLLANSQASVNHFQAVLSHSWTHGWSSEVSVHQTTFWVDGSDRANGSQESFGQGISAHTDYSFSDSFSLGAGYRYYDFQFTGPGRADAQAHWPFGRLVWSPAKNLHLSGIVGVIISHTQGTSTYNVNPAGLGLLQYEFYHGRMSIYGGQEPELVSALGGVGIIRSVRGNVVYEFTPRLSGEVGGGYSESSGTGFNGEFISWGVGLSDRLDRWVSVTARFVQVRINETSANRQFLPNSLQNGREAVGNYVVIGMNISLEAFRWSWQ